MPLLRLRSFTVGLLATSALAIAQTPTTPAPSAESITFHKLAKGKQVEVQAAVLAGLPAHPWVVSLRALAAETGKANERAKPRAFRRGKRTIEFPRELPPLPQRCDYLFGVGTIEERSVAPGAPAAKAKERSEAVDGTLVEQALLGCVPGADRALARLLQRLDVDTTADAFAAFLQSWRNGDESFYEALDRTAGTKDSVFFFDAMLDDFRGQFAGSHGDPALRGLQAAHDALHAAFLAYRQYRGFREAVAWSLVLPPDRPLPVRLARYEAKTTGAYSLREQVTMVAAAMDHELAKVADGIAATAAPLPKPLWSGAHDPYVRWNETFAGLLPRMIERAGSSDAFLQRSLAERRELATAIAAAGKQQVLAAAAGGH